METEQSRIKGTDSIMDIVVKMAGGNPGAATVLMYLIKESPSIDPQSMLGGIGPVLLLDTAKIYEERIWLLYKDVCKESIVKTIACVRGFQLGLVSGKVLHSALNHPECLDVDDLLKRVKEKLSDFDKN